MNRLYFVRLQKSRGWTETAEGNPFSRIRDAITFRNRLFKGDQSIGACWIDIVGGGLGLNIGRYGSVLRRDWQTEGEDQCDLQQPIVGRAETRFGAFVSSESGLK